MKGTRPLDNTEIRQVSGCFTGTFEARNRGLFMLGVSTGGRISELLSLQISDVWQNQRAVTDLLFDRSIVKGGEISRAVPVNSDGRRAISDLIAWHRERYRTTRASRPLFPSRNQNGRVAMNRQTAHELLKKALFAVSLMLLVVLSFGCDEVLLPTQIEFTEVPVVETTLPGDVRSAMKIQADERTRIVAHRIAYDGDDAALLALRQQYIDKGLDTFDFHAAQRAYYTKYIDAVGIAVVGNDEIADEYFLRAREAVHVMTSKHPALKERLLSKHGTFYMILVPYNTLDEKDKLLDVPELMLNTFAWEHGYFPADGSCYTKRGPASPVVTGYCFQKVMRVRSGDLCYNGVHTYDGAALDVFVHEFSHALEGEMERLKPGFRERQREAYEAAGGASGTGINVYYEYWAAAVTTWFYSIGDLTYPTYDAFFDKHPLVAELLDEWFPRVSLRHDLNLTVTYTDDCKSCDDPDLCRELKAKREKNQE